MIRVYNFLYWLEQNSVLHYLTKKFVGLSFPNKIFLKIFSKFLYVYALKQERPGAYLIFEKVSFIG